MAENKTRPTQASVAGYLAAITDEARRKDCEALAALIAKATGLAPVMWGPGIVGYGSYHYRYESGREGDSCLVGFATRKGDISIYTMGDFPARAELLAKLGKHKTGKGCLYLRRLSDVDPEILSQLVVQSITAMKNKYR